MLNVTYNYNNWNNFLIKHRYLQVTESITIVSIFNTLRYCPSKRELFNSKLIKYSKTLPNSENNIIKYEYVKIIKQKTKFEFISAAYYFVNLKTKTVSEQILNPRYKPGKKALYSPIRESIDYGSYVKK